MEATINCTCGETLVFRHPLDKHRADVISFQDIPEFQQMIRGEKKYDQKIAKELFQCEHCNNLILLSEKGRFDFSPIGKAEDFKELLISYHGKKWKGRVIGECVNGLSSLFWESNSGSGFLRDIDEIELKAKYFEKKEEFLSKGILGYSHLYSEDQELDVFNSEKG